MPPCPRGGRHSVLRNVSRRRRLRYRLAMATVGQVQDFAVARRFPRHKIDLPVRVVVPLEDKTRIVSGRGNELNEGGLQVFAGTEMRVGDSIFVEFTPPYSGKPVRVAALVRNRSGFDYGLEFAPGDLQQQQRVADFRLMLRFATGGTLT